jgi:hypothetical protein
MNARRTVRSGFAFAAVLALALASPLACGSFGEAGSPASSAEGGSTEGGSAEGGSADAGRCGHTFCAFFDGPTAAAEWPSSRADVGPLELDTLRFVSPPSALRIVAGPDAKGRVSYVERTFAAAQHYRFSASVRLETPGAPDGEVDLVDLELDPPPDGFTRYFVGLVGKGTGDLVVQYQTPDNVITPLGAGAARFVAVVIDLDLDAGKLVVEVAGNRLIDANVAKAKSKGITLSVGLPYTDHTMGTYIADIDDVTFD